MLILQLVPLNQRTIKLELVAGQMKNLCLMSFLERNVSIALRGSAVFGEHFLYLHLSLYSYM